MKSNVLFVCIHNSARSQMAEAFLKQLAGDKLDVYSAGIEKGTLNPYVVRAMQEVGIDISRNGTKTVHDPEITSRDYDYVFTVCQESDAQPCPIYPTNGQRINWHFMDPSTFTGDDDAIMEQVRRVRDRMKQRVQQWFKELYVRSPR